jgi:hypothetical protein
MSWIRALWGLCETHDKWQSRNVGEEETGSRGGNIGNENLDEKHDTSVSNLIRVSTGMKADMCASYLVDHSACSKCLCILRACLDYSSNGIENDRDEDKFCSAENICNFGRGGLKHPQSAFVVHFRGLSKSCSLARQQRSRIAER